ncbi:transcriptional regulator LldR [Oligella urethralis]|uniref:Transcriptional regulator n=1 Tax=Oligella urethralis DNF00040 TaxID=1401065 RepID=A0A095ZA52_9BURK|nr:transcriptional regulator LldR [Oligella urethralis]KGF31665.1 transcriptional regulator [Oligella urethralis DNF00040]
MTNNFTRVADKIKDQIKQLIQARQLAVGERLPSERDLAELFEVSRSAVREAIRALNSQGLVVTRPGGGTFVQTDIMTWPSQSFATLTTLLSDDPHYRYDVLEARHALEISTAWYAAQRATPEDKRKIQTCLDIMLKHQQRGEMEEAAQADARFHLAIAEASHNLVLLQIMRGLFDLVFSTVKENRRLMFTMDDVKNHRHLTEQHEAVMQAIVNHDPERAKTVMGEHLDFVSHSIRSSEEDAARIQRMHRLSEVDSLF